MSKKELFNFLLGAEVEYILKRTNGKSIIEEKGILELREDENLAVVTKTKEVLINVDKAQDINIVDVAGYVEFIYTNSIIELRKSLSKEDILEEFCETINNNFGYGFDVSLLINNEMISQCVGVLSPVIIEDDVMEIESNTSFRFVVDLKNIKSIKKEYDEALLFIIKMKDGWEIIVGFEE